MDFRSTTRGYVKFAAETGMLGPAATVVEAMPEELAAAGYIDLPSVRRPEGAQGIESIGAYQEVETVPGSRAPSMSLNMRVGGGSASFLRHALRSSGLGGYHCQPVLALRTGAVDPCTDGGGFNWDVRYGMINSLGLQFQEGQPVSASLEIPALAIVPGTVEEEMALSDLQAAAGRTFTFFHLDWVIGSTSYREYLQSVSIQLNNNVRPVGTRNDLGWNNPLSRAPRVLMPSVEKLQVSYRMYDFLPGALHDAANASGNWGSIIIRTNNLAVSSGGRNMAIAISNNMLNSHDMEAVQPGQPFGFSATTTSRVMAITVASS